MFSTIQADQDIINKVQIFIVDSSITGGGADPINEWPLPSRGRVLLQFPPRIKGNSKQSRWKEEDVTSYEPVAFWIGSSATKLSIELKYVVTGGDWGVDKIAKTVHTIMGYFYRPVQGKQKVSPPLIQLILYEIAPAISKMSTWRMDSASVDQSDELILDLGKTYPQVTTIKMDLQMVTKIGADASDGDSVRQLKETDFVSNIPRKEWY